MPRGGSKIDTPPSPLPPLLPLAEVQRRLHLIFPDSFPDRSILVGSMAAKVIYVFLYGGFIEGAVRCLRPSYIYLFTDAQANKVSVEQRNEWAVVAGKSGFRPEGIRWYADTSRESIRDDLMRNQLLRMGIAHKLSGEAVTSSKPIWYLDRAFAELFNAELVATDFDRAVEQWRLGGLDPATLQRMALKAQGALRKEGDVFVEMPDGSRMRISAGPSSNIAKALIEQFAPRHLGEPAVLWLSASDKKSYAQFAEMAASVGLRFDLNAELPDLILADLRAPVRILLCEVVATDGPVTESRKQALLKLVRRSKLPEENVEFLSAFDDREAVPFKKSFSSLAVGSLVWFRTEPELLVTLERMGSIGAPAA